MRLPPYSSFIKELILTSLTPLIDYVKYENDEILLKENKIEIKPGNRKTAYYLLQLFDYSLEILREKQKAVYSPNAHVNDQAVFSKMLGRKLDKPSYLNLAEVLLEWARNEAINNPDVWTIELETVDIRANKIKLGTTTFAPLQIFKVEKYEYGKGFGDFEIKFDFEISKYWYSLIVAGFVIGYNGYVDEEFLITTITEDLFQKLLIDPVYADSIRGLLKANLKDTLFSMYNTISNLRIPATNSPSFQIAIAFHVYKRFLSKHLERLNEIISALSQIDLPFRVYRLRYDGKSITQVELIDFNLSPLLLFTLKFAKRLRDEGIENDIDHVLDLMKATLFQMREPSNYYKNLYGDISVCLRLSNALYNAIFGSVRPEEVVYSFARLSSENSPLKKSRLLKAIYDSL